MAAYTSVKMGDGGSPPQTERDRELLDKISNTRAFSKNPRWKRHTSLDAGVAVIRRRESAVSELATAAAERDQYSPISYLSTPGVETRLMRDFLPSPSTPTRSPFSEKFGPGAPGRGSYSQGGAKGLPELPQKQRGRVLAYTSLVMGLCLLIVGGTFGAVRTDDLHERFPQVAGVLANVGLTSTPSFCENPFAELGRLTVDSKVPDRNRWIPYDRTCSAPRLMSTLRASMDKTPVEAPHLELPIRDAQAEPLSALPLPWLKGKTVVLFGDHIERQHNEDFCRFGGGKFTVINATHPLSPPPYKNGYDERLGKHGAGAPDAARPGVCYLEEYDFMVVSVFHYGLASRVEFEHEHMLRDPSFYPPVAINERLSHVLLPVLKSLEREKVDLLEFSSGFWDLRHFSALDEVLKADQYSELSVERLKWYSDRLSATLKELAEQFPDTQLLWRTLHQTPKYVNTPFNRIAALDHLSRQVVHNVNLAHRKAETRLSLDDHEPNPKAKGTTARKSRKPEPSTHVNHGNFLNRLKDRIAGGSGGEDEAEGTTWMSSAGSSSTRSKKRKIRIDEWGSLMLGQQHLMNKVQTPALPGGFLWGDILLFELRRASEAPSATEKDWRGAAHTVLPTRRPTPFS